MDKFDAVEKFRFELVEEFFRLCNYNDSNKLNLENIYDTINDICDKCVNDMKCKYCEHENNDFVTLNETTDYSSIEMALNRQGMLRVRYYEDSNQVWFSQDIINIKFCPICGRKLNT